MLMSMFHIAVGVSLMALIMGISLMKCASKCCCKKAECDTQQSGCATKCMKCGSCCGLVLSIIAALSLACTLYSGFKFWKAGMFDMAPAMMMMQETVDMGDSSSAQE